MTPKRDTADVPKEEKVVDGRLDRLTENSRMLLEDTSLKLTDWKGGESYMENVLTGACSCM